MFELLKKEKADVERKLGNVRGVSIATTFFITITLYEKSVLFKVNYFE